MPDKISKELEAIEDEENDDYFEKVLKTELDLPTDDDDEKKAEEKEEKKEEAKEPTIEEQLKVASDKVVQLEKEAKGRLTDTIESRQAKATMKRELTELKSAVSSLLEKRDGAGKEEDEKKPLLEETKIGIQFDEEEKAFVDLKDVKTKIEEESKQTREDLEEIKAERVLEAQKAAFKKAADDIIQEDPKKYDPSFPILREAFEDLNNAVIALQTRLEIKGDENGSIEQERALDLLHGSEELKTFNDKHPGIDPIKVARAFNSNTDFRESLRNIADVKQFGLAENDAEDKDVEAKLNEKIKAAKDKPGSLAGSSDQAGGTADLLARIADLDPSEIENMSNAEVAKIELMLEKEAQGE